MNKQKLIEKLQDIEWEDFECKEAKSEVPKSSWESVSAFSNTAGGWLVFGVKKLGKEYEITGVKNPEKVSQDFLGVLRGNKFNKIIEVKSKKYNFREGTVLGFYIPISNNKPVYYDNPRNTFIRTGSGDQRATREEIDSMFRDSSFGTKDKETTKFKLNNLSSETLERYRTYLKNLDSSNPYNKLSDEEMFERLRVTIDGKVTIAGLLMFGTKDKISEIFPDFMIDYLEVPGTSYSDSTERYTYRMPLHENLFDYFFSLAERLQSKIDIPFKLKGFFRDENQPQVKAIREALVNLLAHSDYFSNMKPRIRIFLDRIEFMNPGSLPAPLEMIRKQELTLPRNPILIKLFRVLDLAENGGYGFDKMFNGWKSYYKVEPNVENEKLFYKISFPLNPAKNQPKTSQKDGERDGIKDGERDGINSERIKKLGERLGKKLGERLGENQLKIILIMQDNKTISINELSEKIGINQRNIEKNISKLQDKNIIKRVGPAKGGSWEIL